MTTFDAESESKLAIESTSRHCIRHTPCNHEWCPCTLSGKYLANFDVLQWCGHHKVGGGITAALMKLKRNAR